MTERPSDTLPRRPLRVWPGVVAVTFLFLARFGLKAVLGGFNGFATGMMWSLGTALVVVAWWLFFSRAPWLDRLAVPALMAAGLYGAWQLRHGSMGPLWLLAYAVPLLCLALVAAAVAGRRLADGPRRALIAGAVVAACAAWTLVRTDGISGDHVADFGWRWAKSPEERLLAQTATAPATPPATLPSAPVPAASPAPGTPSPTRDASPAPASVAAPTAPPAAPADAPAAVWPGFRGPGRDGVARGARIGTDWAASPPVELWRRAVGPGWSSFAVLGDRVYTQEQRGEDEVVACYRAATGAEVWIHRDPVRFFESNAGAGPRGTPTLSGGRVYSLGGTGLLNALDATTGAVVWSRDAASDVDGTVTMGGAKTKVPDWGFSSSPLVVDDVVVVAVAGQLVGYERATGRPRWRGPAGGTSYSSPQLATIGGVPQILHVSAKGATSVAPADGRTLWQHAWRGFPIIQPAVTADGDVLLTVSGDSGTRRLAVTHGPDGWTVTERWTSAALKPYFNDFVVHEGHAFGFDGRILACLDLADGARKWKGGRYGNGQLVLLPEQDLLLVLSEDGELALVRASPDQFTEVGRMPAIEGKTWNHPALVDDVLLVRNGAEMAAFRLSPGARADQSARPATAQVE
jgi:outer membrane protein assembly factor BamB